MMKEEFIKSNPAWHKVSDEEIRGMRGGCLSASANGVSRPGGGGDLSSFLTPFLSIPPHPPPNTHTPTRLQELELMVKTKEKAEIQSLSSFDFQYLTQVYLPKKLAQGDWV
jgi:hypothetical protein